jgi:hypothetical protein
MDVSMPALGFVAATRALTGAGFGLLLAGLFSPDVRRALGWTLLGIGALTTVPIAARVIERQRHPEPRVVH